MSKSYLKKEHHKAINSSILLPITPDIFPEMFDLGFDVLLLELTVFNCPAAQFMILERPVYG